MFKMIEVIGISAKGYSEACDNAIDTIIKNGEKPHFFEIVEQRGSIKENRVNQYQVKMKIAVEDYSENE